MRGVAQNSGISLCPGVVCVGSVWVLPPAVIVSLKTSSANPLAGIRRSFIVKGSEATSSYKLVANRRNQGVVEEVAFMKDAWNLIQVA